MAKLLLSLHVLAAILAIGPVAVAASMFPRYAKPPSPGSEGPHDHDLRTAALLHRVCRGYTVVGIAVPVFGVATGARLGVLTDAWLLVSMVLTAMAAAVLLMAILPGQRELLERPSSGAATEPPSSTGGPAHLTAPGEEAATAEVAPTGAATATGAVPARRAAAVRLAMTTGIFNLIWAVVVVLMIFRPGSTTSA